MAGHPVLRLDLGQERIHLYAYVHGHGAARGEAAAGWRVHGTWDVAGERGRAQGGVGIGHRCRCEQSLGVGMQRVGVDFATRGELHDTAEIHHGDPRTEMLDHRQVVSDEKIRERQRNAEVCHQVQYLGLDRDVQRGHGLVGDDEIRVQRQGAGDGDSLRLSARDLVREAARVVGVEAD